MTVRIIQFLVIVISAAALIPAGAHFAALPNKIDMPKNEYFTVQAIYRGWAILGLLWPAGVLGNALLAILVRNQERPFWLAAVAAFCFILTLAIFFLWTFPANRATSNWTQAPENWEALRRRWEYSHAANTFLVFTAFSLTTLSSLSWRSP